MLLTADSGSYKTDWAIINNKEITQFNTIGLNPYNTKYEDLENALNHFFPANHKRENITKIYFYGAGCRTKEEKNKMGKMLSSYFFNAKKISVDSDLLGASRALLDRKKGIIAIIGTGTNCGFYDGEKILQLKPSMGYILGDEGSGAWLGKRLLQSYLNNNLPENLRINFEKKFNKIGIELISELYSNPRPNMYLADFAVFYCEHTNHATLMNIIKEGFNRFILNYIIPYTTRYSFPVSFCGSVAYVFSEQLKKSLSEYNIVAKDIIQSPIKKLAERFMTHSG